MANRLEIGHARFSRRLRRPFALSLAAAIAMALTFTGSVPRSIASTGSDPSGKALLCVVQLGSPYQAVTRPSRCIVFGPRGGFDGGVILRRIEWRSWGGHTARGDAATCGPHGRCRTARVAARRPRHACGREVYTRLTVVSGRSSVREPLPSCAGPIASGRGAG